jgi:puromycin-sensitive aminopeptidase
VSPEEFLDHEDVLEPVELERTDVAESPFRLPRTVVPDHYDITLDVDPARDTFVGSVGIDVRVLESTERIVLNTADLDLDEVALSSGSATVAVVDVSHDDRERTTLQLETPVDVGSYRLDITYRGIVDDQLRGLYRSVYEDADGVQHPIATSQCQPTDARRILPCWDEPDFKATFRTTMIVPEGVEAYSNGAEVSREQTDGRTTVAFAPTMKMSTYLLAFIAGPFEATPPVVVRGTPIRIVVPRGNLHRTDVAMENAIFSFEFMSDYFGIPYPGDKLDHIAVPDFAAGAMENVGLITYRTPYLVIDRANASQSELQTSLDVIAHEVAHQWFGNLVTMAWWEGTWLNEAFANLMQMKATDARRPEWKRWLAFANVEVPWAMGIDQLGSTRPVEFEVTAPEEVNQMFDAITYGKGSAVLHMVDEFVGTESFRAGVRDYLHAHEYANTATADLFESLDQESEWPISEIMSTWIFRKGFPQIEVSRVAGGARLSQHRYLVIPDAADATTWQVPMELRGSLAGEDFSQKVLLTDDEMVVDVGDVDWIVANVGGHGFYRTHYSDELFTALLAHVEQLDDLERYWLVSDTLALVRNGEVDASSFLDLVVGFADEREQAIWSVITGGLGTIEHHALTEVVRPAFEASVRSVVGQRLDRLGSRAAPDDSDLDRRLRGDLIVAMGVLGGDPATVERCAQIVEQLLSGSTTDDPEVTTAALTVFAHGADAAGYERLWNTYRAAQTPIDEARFLRAVAGVPDLELATRTLDRILDGSIRTQDRAMVFARLLSGRAGPTVWRRAAEQWDALLAAVPSVTHSRIVEGISALSQPGVADEVEAFLTAHPMPEAAHAVRQNLERLDANVRLRARQTPAVTAYFAAYLAS